MLFFLRGRGWWGGGVSVCFAMGCTDYFWQSFTTKPRDTRSSLRRVSVGLSLAFFYVTGCILLEQAYES